METLISGFKHRAESWQDAPMGSPHALLASHSAVLGSYGGRRGTMSPLFNLSIWPRPVPLE